MRFAVLGAGLMGRAAVYDLARSREVREILAADVREPARLALLLRGCDVVLNCTQYYWNVAVMRAALRARVHYLDLGGLFHETRRQLRLDAAFRRAGRLALVGMGGAPGLTNVMARWLADRLDRVESIRVLNGAVELNPPADPLAHTFSIATILDELTLAPMAFLGGRLREQPLFSGEEPVRFPPPLGRLVLQHSLHSELATLPRTFRAKGVREVVFKINYDPRLIEAARLLTRLGLLDRHPVRVGGTEVSPRALLERVLASRAVRTARVRDVEVLRVVVTGKKAGRRRQLSLDATTRHRQRPSFTAVAQDTGFPASIAAQMIARGQIRATGVRAPEEVVPPAAFFAELEKRRIRLRGAGWPSRE